MGFASNSNGVILKRDKATKDCVSEVSSGSCTFLLVRDGIGLFVHLSPDGAALSDVLDAICFEGENLLKELF